VPNLLSDQKILIIDDSRTSSILVKQQLVSIGVAQTNVFTAHNCQDAIQTVESHYFNIIIIDYHLEQSITGFELASILYRNKLIHDAVGILIISGDSRQQTVLTSLSGKVRHFISKPINNKTLQDRLSLLTIESHKITKLRALFPIKSETLLTEALSIINVKKICVSAEANLFEHLIEQKRWDLLQTALSFSSSPDHPYKIIGQAHVFHSQNLMHEALESLHKYLIEHPLSLHIIDLLSSLYEEQGEIDKALHYAQKAFDLTPSISHRAVRASQLAEKLGKREDIIKIGYTYACHISLADSQWIQSVSAYLLTLESCYKSSVDPKVKQLILKHLGNFASLVSKRVTSKRVIQLRSMMALFQCHILIHEDKAQQAHQKVLKGLSLFYNNFSDCPSPLLAQYTPALMYFGESNLCHSIQSMITSRGSCDTNSEKMHRLFSYTTVSRDHASLEKAEKHLGQYPLSVGAKLDYLYSSSLDTTYQSSKASYYVDELSKLDLPPNWSQWFGDSLRNGFATKPPSPFSLLN